MDDYYGYKLHLLTDANHEIPIGWTVTPANTADCTQAVPIFDEAKGEFDWFAPEHFMADKGYDDKKIHEKLEGQYDCHPIIPLRDQRTVHKDSFDEHGCPMCYQREKFIWNGSDYKRKRSNWVCPVKAGRMKPKTGLLGCNCGDGQKIWVNWKDDPRRHSLVPRGTGKFEQLYNKRGSVEREYARLKGQYILDNIRVQGIEKVRLHANLSIFTRLLVALADRSPP